MSEQQHDDPYAALVVPLPQTKGDPYAALTKLDPGGDVDLGKPSPGELRTGKLAQPIAPPPFAPRDASAVTLGAHQAYRPGALERGVGQAGQFLADAVHDPVGTATGLVTAPIRSAVHAVLSPGIGEARPDARLSKGGNSSGRPIDTSPYDAEHGGITDRERTTAGLQTVANVAFPGIEGAVAERAATAGASPLAGKLLGLSVAGAPAGAAYSPDDPAAGLVAGGLLAPLFGLAHEGASKGTTAGLGVVRGAVDRVAPAAASALESVRSAVRTATTPADAPDPYAGLTTPKDTPAPPIVPPRGAEGQGGGSRRGVSLDDAPPSLTEVHDALGRLRDQHANATDPMERGELESRISMLEGQRRALTGEPEPDMAGADKVRAATAAGVRHVDDLPATAAGEPERPYGHLTGEETAGRDLFGEKVAPTEPAQGGLFGAKEGTDAARNLRETEAASRAQLDQLRQRLDLTTDPAERQDIAARMAPLEKLVNRGEKIGAEEMGHRAAAESPAEAPAPDAQRVLTFRDLLDMPADQIRRHADEAIAADSRIEPEVFGAEGAKRYRQLQRTANSTTRSHEETARASDEVARMEDALTEAQRNRLYGIGQKGLSAEDLKAAADAARDYSGHHVQVFTDADLRSTIARELTTGRAHEDPVSALRLRGAVAEIQRRTGESLEDAVRYGMAERGRRGYLASGAQADELFRARMQELREAGLFSPAEDAAARQLPAGDDPYAETTAEAPPSPTKPRGVGSKRSGVVLDEDGTHRFDSARTPGGAKRPVDRVSTPGLLDELLDMEHRRANAEAGSVYEWTPDDNFHATDDGASVEHATRRGKGPSRQAKAQTNLDAFARAQRAIEVELAQRGLAGDALTERLQAHNEMREERRAIAGDYDPANARRDQVRNAAGDVLFSQTPGAFAREVAASRAAEGKPPRPASAPGPRVEEVGQAAPPATRMQQRMAVVRSAIKVDAFKDAVLKVFGPASRSEDAGRIALAIRDAGGSFARRNEMARQALKEFAGTFDRMPQSDRLDFIDRVEGGRPQENPALQKAADIMRHLLDSARDEIRGLGTGKLSHWIENYFPHLWENPEDAVTFIDRVMSKRSMSGPGTFLKQRSIPTLREGIEAGLVPLTTNPIDMTLLKLREMHKYLAGQQILAELKQSGLAKFVSALERGPSGLVKLDDKLGTIYGPPHVEVTEGFDKVVRGKLEGIMQELGVTHTRRANIGGRGRMGYAEGDRAVTTKAGGPDTVIEHELGHILDAKLGVWDRLTKIPGTDRVSIDARKQLHQELRDLADMRMEGEDTDNLPASYKTYLRKKEEKVANAVHALVYMPERMQEVAPMVKARLTDILKSHPIASKLLDVKPSLALGTAEYHVPVGGLVVKGHWYVPEPVGRVINNHLSPGLAGNPFYDLYRGVGNAMNQWQLGFSAFHLGFTSMDAAVSKTALGIEQGFAGRPLDAAKSLASVPISPLTNYLRGSKVLREYLTPGTEGGEMAATVDALVRGGGRVRMDEYYGGGAVKQFREALNANKIGRAARLSLPALMEGSSKLVMEHIVPRQKLGVFADLAQFELSKLPPDATPEQMRQVMAHAWDSVDNRMGQLVYDNLFWHRVAKDLTMASVRSVGWNVGTIRELGGGIADLTNMPRRLVHRGMDAAHVPGDWQGAREPLGLSHRAAYVMALPITVGIAGGIINYLYTGQHPRELKDYFYPRTGRKNPDGTDERIQLPSYMRDVGDYARHPVQTLVNKLHPLAGTIRDMLANEDFYGHEIHNPDDPMVQQAMQQATYVAGQFEPFGVRNAVTQIKQGQGRSAALNFVGITPAPREETRTAADLRMSQEMGRRARGNLTPEEVAKQGQRRGLMGALRSHDPNAGSLAADAMHSGAIAPKDLGHVLHEAAMPPDVLRFSKLPVAEALNVYKMASPEEKQRFGPVLFKKMDAAKRRGTLLDAVGIK